MHSLSGNFFNSKTKVAFYLYLSVKMRMFVEKNHGIKDQITTARLIKYLFKYVFL